jgi:flagellar motor switch protein FliN/FliY
MSSEVESILKLSVPVIVQLGRRSLSMDDVLSLGPGTIVELTKHHEEELELLANNKPIGSGTAVKVGENFGLRVNRVGDMRQRIEALGDAETATPAVQGPADAPPAEALEFAGEVKPEPAVEESD